MGKKDRGICLPGLFWSCAVLMAAVVEPGLGFGAPGLIRAPPVGAGFIRSCSQKMLNIHVILNGAQRSEESRLLKREILHYTQNDK
jgi:hypothetical protein